MKRSASFGLVFCGGDSEIYLEIQTTKGSQVGEHSWSADRPRRFDVNSAGELQFWILIQRSRISTGSRRKIRSLVTGGQSGLRRCSPNAPLQTGRNYQWKKVSSYSFLQRHRIEHSIAGELVLTGRFE
jgi:hypothetical protein